MFPASQQTNFQKNIDRFGRQNSALSEGSLNNVETEDMRNMLETDIDLTPYTMEFDLDELNHMMDDYGNEKNPEKPSADDVQNKIQIQHVLYNDLSSHPVDDYSYHNLHNTFDDYEQVYSAPTPMIERPIVKMEQVDEGEESDSSVPSSSRTFSVPRSIKSKKDIDLALKNYKPQTKARSYKLKPDQEKQDPHYKLKRARNNDAVRKSRSKAKELQMKREKELNDCKKKLQDEVDKNSKLTLEVEGLRKENATLRSRLVQLEHE